MKLFQFSILPFLLLLLGSPDDSATTNHNLPETASTAALAFPSVPIARWTQGKVDIAEDDRVPLDPAKPVSGYYYLRTQGYAFATSSALIQWMSLDVKMPSTNKMAKAKPRISRTTSGKTDKLPTIGIEPANRTASRTGTNPRDFNYAVAFGPEHYEKLIVTYSSLNNDHRTKLESQPNIGGYTKRKELGYLITKEGYKLLRTLKSAVRLNEDLTPVYQWYHDYRKDWILTTNHSEYTQAQNEGFTFISHLGYLGKVNMQPANCDGSGSSTCPPNISSLYTNPKNGHCYCKPFGPK